MTVFISPELAGAYVGAQGVAATSESATSDAKFATQLLERSARAFARLSFEDEPSSYTAALRRNAP